MKPFIQIPSGQHSTLAHWQQILSGNKLESVAAFAYITDSGAAAIHTHLKKYLGTTRKSRWLLSFDYGRSHPTALQKLRNIGNSTIRIYDGHYVVQAKAFKPRTSYHLKTALTLRKGGSPRHQIVGSGNLSVSGLQAGIEAGCVVDYSAVDEKSRSAVVRALEDMWENAAPLEKVLRHYEKRYAEIILPTVSDPSHADAEEATLFWIDIGYVTQNRGADKPGNQFDLPRGSHVYLGVRNVTDPQRNSVLGEIEIRTPTGDVLPRRLRHGNNDMEKLTLPIPENYGYDSYDGKILLFERDGDEIALDAYEPEDFYRIYGKRITSVNEMRGGRRFGTVSLVK
jgi:HKD family nuclease